MVAAAAGAILVVMAKAPRGGQVKTRLTPPLAPDEAAALYGCMLSDTVRMARATGLATAAVVPAHDVSEVAAVVGPEVEVVAQAGRGLADALVSVFTVFAARGCRRIVAIDSDSPTLPETHLRSAYAALDRHDVVLGPTSDGGYYLVGARRLHDGLFAPSALGTASALQAIEHSAARSGLTCARTADWYDVDIAADLPRLVRELRDAPGRAPATAALLASWRHDVRLAAVLAGHGE